MKAVISDGRGVDHVVEVEGPGTLGQSIDATRIGGDIALIGVLTGAAGPVPTASLMMRHQKLHGIIVGSRQQQMDLVSAINATNIRPVIDRSFPLEGIAGAFRLQQTGNHFGKIVLEL